MSVRIGVAGERGNEQLVLLDADRLFGAPASFPGSIAEALQLPLDELKRRSDVVRSGQLDPLEAGSRLLAPIDRDQEVWASGVTYERSLQARVEESTEPSVYDLVYGAERPELFLKSPGYRVVGPGEPVGIRSDSAWNVPEPELALVVNAFAEIVGYTLGNDMSSRSIEGENPLYLPQAKIYDRACALGPCIVPAWDMPNPSEVIISISVSRGGGEAFSERTSVSKMKRSFQDLVDHLFRCLTFSTGVFVLTGTGIVPSEGFTLLESDVVRVEAPPIGILENPVIAV